jgi:hypothetical protein
MNSQTGQRDGVLDSPRSWRRFGYAGSGVVFIEDQRQLRISPRGLHPLSGEFLIAARQKEPKALDRQQFLLRLAASVASIRYSDSARADSGCRVQRLLESLAKPGPCRCAIDWGKSIEGTGLAHEVRLH